jgi:CheY-like chemotaxis protein
MRTILVVDDHAVSREPLAKLLRYEGYETASAANGAEALRAVAARRPDLVLLDVMMPKMDGLTFLEAARQTPGWGDVPVIVLTGVLDPNQIARAKAMNVREVMPKAKFTIDDLLCRIREHLPAA